MAMSELPIQSPGLVPGSASLAGSSPGLPAAPGSELDPVRVLAALGSAWRWQIFQMMVDGQELTINGLVATMRRSYNAVHKDMDVLCAAGVVRWRLGADQRVGIFFIPEEFLRGGGVVEFGFGQFRLPSTGPVRLPKD